MDWAAFENPIVAYRADHITKIEWAVEGADDVVEEMERRSIGFRPNP